MYRFFVSDSIYSAKRLQFFTLITSALTSGLESYDLCATDIRKLECSSLKKFRARSKHKASTIQADGVKRQVSNFQIWSLWKIVPLALELSIRRIKWWQQISMHPTENSQLFASMFSTLGDTDMPALRHNGTFVTEHTINFGARNLQKDIGLILASEGGHEFSESWYSRDVTLLFSSGPNTSKDAFQLFDAATLRAEFLMVTKIAPILNHVQEFIPNPDAIECDPGEDDEAIYICELLIDGTNCGQAFKSRRALIAHQRGKLSGHGQYKVLYKLQVCNRCLICSTVFKTKSEAALHLTRSWHSGRCIKDNVHEIYTFHPPTSFSCPICLDLPAFINTTSLECHLSEPIPPPPKG